MARASSIDRLPQTLKDDIVDLRKQGVSIDRIREHLRELGAEVSRAALGRHTAEVDALLKDALEAREVARALKKDWEADADDALPSANVEFLQVAIMKLHMAVRRGEMARLDAKEVLALSKASESLSRAQRLNLDTILKIKEEQESKTKDAAAKAAETVGREKGLTSDTIQAIKAQILGVKVGE